MVVLTKTRLCIGPQQAYSAECRGQAVAHVTDAISNGRRQNLDEYIKKIIAMPTHISKSILVRKIIGMFNIS